VVVLKRGISTGKIIKNGLSVLKEKICYKMVYYTLGYRQKSRWKVRNHADKKPTFLKGD